MGSPGRWARPEASAGKVVTGTHPDRIKPAEPRFWVGWRAVSLTWFGQTPAPEGWRQKSGGAMWLLQGDRVFTPGLRGRYENLMGLTGPTEWRGHRSI